MYQLISTSVVFVRIKTPKSGVTGKLVLTFSEKLHAGEHPFLCLI